MKIVKENLPAPWWIIILLRFIALLFLAAMFDSAHEGHPFLASFEAWTTLMVHRLAEQLVKENQDAHPDADET